MFDRRVLRLAKLMMACLIVASIGILYWQTAHGKELAFITPRADETRAKGSQVKDPTQAGQQFAAGISQALDLDRQPAPVVQRAIDLLGRIRRGTIFDRNGRPLAYDRPGTDGSWERFYTEPSLVHALGYVSGLRIGVAGLENSYNRTLLGLDRPDAQISQLLHEPIQGSDLILTIDSNIQRAADSALEGKRGAIVVLDEHTGAVLAMASSPRFDPNRIHDPDYLSSLLNGCDGKADCQGALINRASQSAYSPGSTWKTVSLIAALDTGLVQPDTLFDFGKPLQGPTGPYYTYSVDGGIIPDFNHTEAQLDLTMAYAKSANAAFAKIGDEILPDVLLDYARRLGFGKPGGESFPLEIEYAPSQIAWNPDALYSSNLLRAETAIGQGEVLTSPLNMSMVMLAVLNGGHMPVPFFVQSIRAPSGKLDEPANRQSLENIMRSGTAQEVREMMLAAVARGTGQKAAVPGLVVGGKTGTAQVGGDAAPHAWFTGFAEEGKRGVIIVVMIENGGEGSQAAAPIFAQIAKVAMLQPGADETEPGQQPSLPPLPEEAPAPESTDPEKTQVTVVPAPSVSPVPDSTPDAGSRLVPAPEIAQNPNSKEITAEDPSCASHQEVPTGSGQFIWPSTYQALSGGSFKAGHPGVDLNSPEGAPVFAADSGLVIFAGWSGLGYGNTVLIDHGNGFRSLYAHLSQVSTYCSAKVEKGKMIGLSGNTGNSTGPHLHFEIRVPGGWINPISVLPTP